VRGVNQKKAVESTQNPHNEKKKTTKLNVLILLFVTYKDIVARGKRTLDQELNVTCITYESYSYDETKSLGLWRYAPLWFWKLKGKRVGGCKDLRFHVLFFHFNQIYFKDICLLISSILLFHLPKLMVWACLKLLKQNMLFA